MTTQRAQRATIRDIARMCGVSTQTVSRVINNRPDVAEQTREAVAQAIARMGYRPSALARSLVQQRSYTLGLIIAGLRYIGVSQTLNGITEQCRQSNYALLIKELPRFDTSDLVPVIESLIAHQVDGIIFAAPDVNDNVNVAQSQLPAACPPILFLKSDPNPRYTTISIDNYGGARAVVEYLISLGRRRIGLISGPLEWLEARQRRRAWEDALADAGLPVSDLGWTTGNWSSASGEAAFAELVRRYPGMDAVFACSDQMALGALHHANAHGIRVPEDLAIAGFDDIAEAAYFSPALTTVRQPLRELGVLAVQTMLAQIEGTDKATAGNTITLPAELVIRESTSRMEAAC